MPYFTEGQAVRVTEIEDVGGSSISDGQVFAATVERVTPVGYVLARLGSKGALWTFCQGSGYAAAQELSRWRLIPAPESARDAATAAGEENGNGEG